MTDMQIDLGGGRARMVDVEYPANSNKAKEEKEQKRVEKVVTGEVTKRRKPLLGRLGGSMVGEDSQTVMQYILFDVLVPAAKNMISDAVSQGVERMLFGDSRPRAANSNRPGYTSYNRVRSGTSSAYERREISPRARATHEFDDIVLASRGEAEDVLDGLRNLIDQFGVARVADLYDLVGITGEFTDHKWGWYDLKNAGVRNIRGGYLVVLPKPEPIE